MSQDQTKFLAEWKGDSQGQLLDYSSSLHGYDLTANPAVYNPPYFYSGSEWRGDSSPGRLVATSGNDLVQVGSPLWPTVDQVPGCQGDHWLGGWDASSTSSDLYSIPYSSKPNDENWTIEFLYLHITGSSTATPGNQYITLQTEDNVGVKGAALFSRGTFSHDVPYVLGVNKSDATGMLIDGAIEIDDGIVHQIVISGSSITNEVGVYVDGSIDAYSPSGAASFGFGPIRNDDPMNYSIGWIAGGLSSDETLYIDDVKITTVPSSEIVPIVPSGNRWLGKWDRTNDNAALYMPLSARPHSSGGSISFYLRWENFELEPNNGSNIIALDTLNGNGDEKWLYVYAFNQDLNLDFTDQGLNEYTTIFNTDVFDGNTHLIDISWNGINTTVKVDGTIDNGASLSGVSIDTGDANYTNVINNYIGPQTSTSGVSIFIDDLKIKDENSALIAEWNGDTDFGQLGDSNISLKPNGHTLELNNNPIGNPSAYINYFPVPEGDRWLAFFNSDGNERTFTFPIEAKPINAAGFISFYVQFSFNADDNTDMNIFGIDTDVVTQDQERYFYIYSGYNGSQQLAIDFTTSDNNSYTVLFSNRDTIFNGNAHKIAISWDGTNMVGYVDDIATSFLDWSNNPTVAQSPDFGGTNFDVVYENSIGLGSDNITNDTYILLDDFTISSVQYLPNTTQNPANFIARWQGNTTSQLKDYTNNGNDLVMNGDIPPIPFFANPPEGDRWTSFNDNDNYDGMFRIPNSIYPENHGSFSCYARFSEVGALEESGSSVYTAFSNGFSRYFSVGVFAKETIFEDSTFFATYTDKNGDGQVIFVPFIFEPYSTYKISSSWDHTGVSIFINDVLIGRLDIAADFGQAGYHYIATSTCGGSYYGFLDAFTLYKNPEPQPEAPTDNVSGLRYLGGDVATTGGVLRGYIGKNISYYDDAGRYYEVTQRGIISR